MPYEVFVTVDYPLDDSVESSVFVAWAEATLAHESAPHGSVSIVIADDATVQALNRDYRGLDEPTDVLSFGLGGLSKPLEPDEPEPFVLPADAPLQIGEIVISHPYAARTAAATDRSIRDELALLTVHAILHLLGHDHLEDDEGDDMRRRETEILGSFGIAR